MMKDFPAQEQAVFLIDDLAARLILMKQDEMNDELPEDVKDILKQHGPLSLPSETICYPQIISR